MDSVLRELVQETAIPIPGVAIGEEFEHALPGWDPQQAHVHLFSGTGHATSLPKRDECFGLIDDCIR